MAASRCGFGGANLVGEKAVRLTFLDEAGVSNPKEEPYLDVAGVMLDPDRHYGALDARLRVLSEEYFPEKHGMQDHIKALGHPFVFHAKDIWHGSGLFPRDDKANWYLKRRMKVLEELSKNPLKFSLNIVWAAIDRREYLESQKGRPAKDLEGEMHAGAYFEAIRKVDRWMVENAPREYTIIFAEDRPEVRTYIEVVHAFSTDRSTNERDHANAFSSTHIAEPIAFVAKYRSAILQVADHCAFIIKRKLQKCPHIEPHFQNIRPMIWDKQTEASNLNVRFPGLLLG